MISSISWVPKGAAKNVPVVAEPPTQEEIDEAIKAIAGREWALFPSSFFPCVRAARCPPSFLCSHRASVLSGSDADDDEDAGAMNIDGAEDEAEEIEEVDEVAQAKAAAKALGRSSRVVDDVTDGLRDLNMDAYDDEDDGTCLSWASPSSVVADICAVW
jgi:periodic tryptophan protein 1